MDSCPTASIILPVVATLITSLENQTGDSSSIKQIKNTLRASIEDRVASFPLAVGQIK